MLPTDELVRKQTPNLQLGRPVAAPDAKTALADLQSVVPDKRLSEIDFSQCARSCEQAITRRLYGVISADSSQLFVTPAPTEDGTKVEGGCVLDACHIENAHDDGTVAVLSG